jgi:hypothetical protein
VPRFSLSRFPAITTAGRCSRTLLAGAGILALCAAMVAAASPAGAAGRGAGRDASLAYTSTPMPTWTHSVDVNESGQVAVDAYSVAGEDHQLGFHFPDWAQYAIGFFGLTGDDGGAPGQGR